MARYKVVINTDSYRPRRCSEKNWEPGTMNDYMKAINGWKSTEHNLKEVRWRLGMFSGSVVDGAYEDPEWFKWKEQAKNNITYYDKLCQQERTSEVTGYGFKQGYINIDSVINELRTKGVVRIKFSQLYDMRQYCKNMNGCYMEITKVV